MTDYTFCPECQSWQMAGHQHKELGLEDYLLSLQGGFYIQISDYEHSRQTEIHGHKKFSPMVRTRRMVLNEHGRKIEVNTPQEALRLAKRYLMTGEV